MADVITRFKLETTQYDSKLRDASQALAQYARQASFAGSEFNKFTRHNAEAARALGSISTSATNAKDKVRELVGAYNQAANAYNALTKEQQQSDWGQALAESVQKLKGRITEAKQELYSMGDSAKGTGGIMDVLKDKFTINIDALKLFNAGMTAAKVALDVAKDAFFASETNVDEWGRTVAATEGIYQSFLQTINNGNFSGFLSGIQNVIDKAKEAYNAMDELNTRMTIINPERAKLQTRATELKAIIRREGKDSEAGKAAQEALRALEPRLSKAFEKESKLNYNAFRSQVDEKLAEAGIKLNKYSPIYQMLMQSFSNDDLYNEFKKRGKGSITTEFKNYNNNGTNTTLLSGYSQTVDTRNLEQKLLDLFTDEWRKTYSPYLTASFSAKGAAASTMLSDARYLKEGGGSGGKGGKGGGGGTTVSYLEGSLGDYEQRIAQLRKEQKEVTSNEAWQGLEDQITSLNVAIKELKGELKVEPYSFSSDAKKMGADFDKEMRDKLSNPDKIIGPGLEKIVKEINKSQEKKEVNLTKEIGNMVGGFSSMVSGIEALGIKVPEGLKDVVNGIQGVMSILSGITTIISAIEAIAAADTIIPFARGGVVHAASGWSGFVPGNSFSGDNIRMGQFALNSGEMVLNKFQQQALAGTLENAGMKDINVRGYLSGKDLMICIDRTGRIEGRGELAFFK